jgi:hypothetical protein
MNREQTTDLQLEKLPDLTLMAPLAPVASMRVVDIGQQMRIEMLQTTETATFMPDSEAIDASGFVGGRVSESYDNAYQNLIYDGDGAGPRQDYLRVSQDGGIHGVVDEIFARGGDGIGDILKVDDETFLLDHDVASVDVIATNGVGARFSLHVDAVDGASDIAATDLTLSISSSFDEGGGDGGGGSGGEEGSASGTSEGTPVPPIELGQLSGGDNTDPYDLGLDPVDTFGDNDPVDTVGSNPLITEAALTPMPPFQIIEGGVQPESTNRDPYASDVSRAGRDPLELEAAGRDPYDTEHTSPHDAPSRDATPDGRRDPYDIDPTSLRRYPPTTQDASNRVDGVGANVDPVVAQFDHLFTNPNVQAEWGKALYAARLDRDPGVLELATLVASQHYVRAALRKRAKVTLDA